jgi:hypothetical protein
VTIVSTADARGDGPETLTRDLDTARYGGVLSFGTPVVLIVCRPAALMVLTTPASALGPVWCPSRSLEQRLQLLG